MKKIFLIFVSLFTLTVFAQTFNAPESVDYDEVRHRWIVGQNGSGEIHILNPSTMGLTLLASGITSGPHGIECVGDTVFVCDGARIKGFNLLTGALVFNVNLGATFLNGLTWDGGDYLFATDFSAKRIYRIRISTATYNLMITTTYTPNGIYYDGPNNRCVFVNWGSNARVQAMSLADSTVSTLYTTSTSNIDGITRDHQCNWYITTWGGNALRKFNPSFSAAPVSVLTGLSSPADIDINLAGDSIGIPNSGGANNVVFYQVPASPLVGNFTANDSSICAGSVVNFTDASTGSPSGWEWTFNGGTPASSTAQNPSITYNTPGSYDVSFIAGDPACGADTIVASGLITVFALPSAPVVTQISSTTLESSSATGNQWNDTGGPISGENGQTFSPATSGDYTVTFTDANGCSSTSAPFSFVVNSIEDETLEAGTIYPNPSNQLFTIRLNEPLLNGTIQLLDMKGSVLVQNQFNGLMMQFDRGELQAGMYLIKLVNESGGLVLLKQIVFVD